MRCAARSLNVSPSPPPPPPPPPQNRASKIGRRYGFDRNGKVEHHRAYRLLALRPPLFPAFSAYAMHISQSPKVGRQSHCGWEGGREGGIVMYVSCLSCLMIYGGHSKSDTTSYLPAPWFLPHTLCLSLSAPAPSPPWGGGGRGRGRFRSRRPEILGWRSNLGRGCADSQ